MLSPVSPEQGAASAAPGLVMDAYGAALTATAVQPAVGAVPVTAHACGWKRSTVRPCPSGAWFHRDVGHIVRDRSRWLCRTSHCKGRTMRTGERAGAEVNAPQGHRAVGLVPQQVRPVVRAD